MYHAVALHKSTHTYIAENSICCVSDAIRGSTRSVYVDIQQVADVISTLDKSRNHESAENESELAMWIYRGRVNFRIRKA